MISKAKTREFRRENRHKRIRKKVFGTSERPRLCVHRSARNLFAQVVDDTSKKTLIGMSTLSKDIKKKSKRPKALNPVDMSNKPADLSNE